MRITSISDVADRRLCTGCGACAYAQPDEIRMVDVLAEGRRPLVLLGAPTDAALKVCPGVGLAHSAPAAEGEVAELRPGWGPVRAMWEGYAADAEIRYAASSGGAATALALFGLTGAGMHGVLHIGARADVPYLNTAQLSRSRAELLASAGSRYAPASPCERLDLVEAAPEPCVFIGKPCDVAATALARADRPALDKNLGVTIAIFCAGTPSTAGTLAMLDHMGVDPGAVESVRYRGNGWPGDATAVVDGVSSSMSYDESWGGILQQHRQWRCYLCADHTGEFADISVGDPWHRPTDGDPGRSLIIARTERGHRFVEAAIAAGALTATPTEPSSLPDSQPNLLKARGAVWGRVGALRLLGLAAPRYENLPTLRYWWSELSTKEKLRSTAGTVRRIRRKRLRSRADLTEFNP